MFVQLTNIVNPWTSCVEKMEHIGISLTTMNW